MCSYQCRKKADTDEWFICNILSNTIYNGDVIADADPLIEEFKTSGHTKFSLPPVKKVAETEEEKAAEAVSAVSAPSVVCVLALTLM